jgi:hypothetical protein
MIAINYDYIPQVEEVSRRDFMSNCFISFEYKNMAEIFAKRFGGVVLTACTDGSDGCAPNKYKYQVWPKSVEGRFLVVGFIDDE